MSKKIVPVGHEEAHQDLLWISPQRRRAQVSVQTLPTADHMLTSARRNLKAATWNSHAGWHDSSGIASLLGPALSAGSTTRSIRCASAGACAVPCCTLMSASGARFTASIDPAGLSQRPAGSLHAQRPRKAIDHTPFAGAV